MYIRDGINSFNRTGIEEKYQNMSIYFLRGIHFTHITLPSTSLSTKGVGQVMLHFEGLSVEIIALEIDNYLLVTLMLIWQRGKLMKLGILLSC